MNMNKANVMKMKAKYEATMVDKFAALLGIDKECITASWSIDAAKVSINLKAADMVNTFNFTYKDENLSVEMESYKLLFDELGEDKYISGIQAKPSSTDLKTLTVLSQTFSEIVDGEIVDDTDAGIESTPTAPIIPMKDITDEGSITSDKE